ncbi:MAG: PadR family transcriptional regulator [Gemmatimonadota bacterium]|nr:PadR family transcriptional regulator [Gemmatimonadota bacterium]
MDRVEPPYLGELEQAVLWTALRLEGDGYGATILLELNRRIERQVSPGALYATLDRLQKKGMIESRLADPDPRRGGRRKRYVVVTERGRAGLARVRGEWMQLWDGVEGKVLGHEEG